MLIGKLSKQKGVTSQFEMEDQPPTHTIPIVIIWLVVEQWEKTGKHLK